MSLDVSLVAKTPVKKSGTGVFVREDGRNVELTQEQIAAKFPGAEVSPREYKTNEVFEYNITHNLGRMAQKADLYSALWRPDEIGCKYAKDITGMLERGLKRLKKDPEGFKKLNPENGWGSYEGLVTFVELYLNACMEYPDAEIEVSR
jgi:hypothetical protein